MLMLLAVAAPPFTYTGALAAGQTLTVRDLSGDVRIRNGDALAIHATRRADHSDPAQVTVRVDRRADGIVVCVRYPNEGNRPCDERGSEHVNENDTRVDFDITVPRAAIVDAATVNGAIDVQHDGAVNAADVNGSVTVDARTIARAVTVNGGLQLRIRDNQAGTLRASDVNGTIDLRLPPDAGLSVDARTVTGDISIPGISVDRARFGPGARATGTVGNGALHATLRTVNGSVRVRR